jgi:NMT1-like family
VPFDLDSIEETLNRRMRIIWVRYATFLSIFGFIAIVGLIAFTVFWTTKATVLKMGVGPKDSRDVEFVEKLAEKLRNDRAKFRIQPVVTPGPVALSDIHGSKAPFDLAVVRGNLDLSTDWPIVAILRQDVVVLIVPAPDAYAAKRGRKRPKIEKVSELIGKRVGIVQGTDGGADLLHVILKHYGIPVDKVKVVDVAPQDLKKAIHDDQVDVVLVAGPQTGDFIAQTVSAASAGKQGPTFIEIDQAEGIGKRLPPYESEDIVAGAFGGIPPEPEDKLTTLKYPIYIVARETLSEDKIAAFAKLLYQDRQSLAYQLPGTVAIESPPTDKDAAVLVHPGAAAYLGDNTKSFFDRYGDQIFYGLLILPIFGSVLAGFASYFRADKNTQRIRQLHRLLQLIKRARRVTSVEELERLQDEADVILGATIQQAERGQLDETGIAIFTLAIDQARAALSEQRTVLLLKPDAAAAHRMLPAPAPAQPAQTPPQAANA